MVPPDQPSLLVAETQRRASRWLLLTSSRTSVLNRPSAAEPDRHSRHLSAPTPIQPDAALCRGTLRTPFERHSTQDGGFLPEV